MQYFHKLSDTPLKGLAVPSLFFVSTILPARLFLPHSEKTHLRAGFHRGCHIPGETGKIPVSSDDKKAVEGGL
jgi:hypothetical protein